METVTIEVQKPSPIDNGPLDSLFARSQAISDAVGKFWEMGLASEAKLGTVEETDAGYKVEIIYRKKGDDKKDGGTRCL